MPASLLAQDAAWEEVKATKFRLLRSQVKSYGAVKTSQSGKYKSLSVTFGTVENATVGESIM